MPNHVHVLIKQGEGYSLSDIVQRWKGTSSRGINRAQRRKGTLWAKAYFDRVMRDDDHFWNSVSYIHRNPVRAGLVSEAADWPYSSLGSSWPLPET